MVEKPKFHCLQAAAKGRPAITEDYCLDECDSAQRGLRAQCPESVTPQMPDDELRDLASSIRKLEKPKMSEEGKKRGWERMKEAIDKKSGK